MSEFEKVTLNELFNRVRGGFDREFLYYVYAVQDDPNSYELNMQCFVGPGPEVTDEDEEIFPEFVIDNSLGVVCSDELLQDVVENALGQRPGVANRELLKALKYYLDRDDFLDL